ncbi:GGDEF domain-containing protein [Rhodococcus sp. P1Y]|uniref:GGDEF domain-containing protein n=1 Tax=Rhodococcus sp. P1Y TaxID=1302308 RepID=UPI000EAC830A|nr:GGDEF domain-containing protein [Rhodococcus sp. P1Y]AYJ48939.1 GGDEF domain-containing protein [Rhodococcus sp. P1Y]
MGRHRESTRMSAPDYPGDMAAVPALHSEPPAPVLRIAVVVQTLLFGAFGVVATFAHDGPSEGLGTVIVYGVCVSTVPVAIVMNRADFGVDWWSRRAPVNNWFVVYCELGVTTVTATFADPVAALHGAMLLALVGAYAAHFAHPKAIWLHIAWSTSYVLALGAWALTLPGQDTISIGLRVVVAILVVNGAVISLSTFSSAILKSNRIYLSDSMTDPLTGVSNRRGLEARAFDASGRVDPSHQCVLLIDIDDFKAVNDSHGHTAGDVVLRLTAMRLTTSAGRHATVARLGGDEFAVVVPHPTPNLRAFADRLRHATHNVEDETPITVSIGAALPQRVGDSPREVFVATQAAADEALYRAKHEGRNRTALASTTKS